MTDRPGPPLQEVPEADAKRLRALKAQDNPLLNALLDAYRGKGWPAASLAAALEMNKPAISKRIERARRLAARAAPELQGLTSEQAEVATWEFQQHQQEQRRIRQAVELSVIPAPPPRPRAMIDGRQLPAEVISDLRRMQRIASRVNGATPKNHPSRRISEQFSEELHRLVTDEDVSEYYLAEALSVTPRAVTSRLERHHFRDPCPSVAGTTSGVYHDRRIGDPGVGAPRLSAEARTALRTAWAELHDDTRAWQPGERTAAVQDLQDAVRAHLADGFTLANLAQSMKLRYGTLQAFLATKTAVTLTGAAGVVGEC